MKLNLSSLFTIKKSEDQAAEDLKGEEVPKVLTLPETNGDENVIDQYWLVPPFSYVTIIRKDSINLSYEIIEPEISEKELIILEETFDHLKGTLIYDTPRKRGELGIEPVHLRRVIRNFDPKMPKERIDVLVYYLLRNFNGYGKLDPLMNDDRIEDITCNGSNVPIFLYHRRYANIQTNRLFDEEELNKFVMKLAQKADKQLSLSTPIIDAALPGGSRAQITFSDIISSRGSSFTIRKFRADPMTPISLIAGNTYDLDLMAHIWLAVENRKSMTIAGGTASGKTSTMNAISFFIPLVAKIVSIEDTREIQLPHINWLPMRTRESANVSGTGNVGMFHLLKAALRQRPEYIIVGEVRGEEAQTLFQAMNTGHTTYSTVHAGNVRETINRLIHNPINVPVAMFNALDLILVQSLLYSGGRGFRRCLSLNEILVVGDEVQWRPLFTWDHRGDRFVKAYSESSVFDGIAYQNGWSAEELEAAIQHRRDALQNMLNTPGISPQELGQKIQETMVREKND
ncbi:type II/IV secretion system ATPase subunit [Methanocalculus sp.]|uniref:type II/IV secretion system ATPase subunit n=1 Tax=Methanocalculus sp. TaxID=2004547 RepID=UPI00271F7794|nr:type II/IV secretion system ATPase subunit [Methanocalculus sp.]MDO8841291.1 type II/IV secretion system ATPase subunit [Methanocalculus sp.]